jgi:peptide methionine sulfoxide reductase MsrB
MHVYGHLVIPEPCFLVRSYLYVRDQHKFAALWPYAVDIEASALVCLGRCRREVLSSKADGVLGHLFNTRILGNV